MSELKYLADRLAMAEGAVAIFGQVSGSTAQKLEALKKTYHFLARSVHPDTHSDELLLATQAFTRLGALYETAQEEVKAGVYGREPEKFSVIGKAYAYENLKPLVSGSCADVSIGLARKGKVLRAAVLKVTREVRDNSLLDNEAKILRQLNEADSKSKEFFRRYWSELLETMSVERDGKQFRANAFALAEGFYSLAEVQKVYPKGLDGRTLAWIWNRLLELMGYLETQGITHGQIVPGNVLINPANHALILIGWTAAINGEKRITTADADYLHLYAPEILKKKSAVPSADVFMAASVIRSLAEPAGLPTDFMKQLDACMRQDAGTRPKAWEQRDCNKALFARLYGERRFQTLTMPTRAVSCVG